MGKETIVKIELKDIERVTKEKSKQGLVSDAINIIMKSKQEVCFFIVKFNLISFSLPISFIATKLMTF